MDKILGRSNKKKKEDNNKKSKESSFLWNLLPCLVWVAVCFLLLVYVRQCRQRLSPQYIPLEQHVKYDNAGLQETC